MRDAGKEGFKKGGIQDRMKAGRQEFRKGVKQDRRKAGQVG